MGLVNTSILACCRLMAIVVSWKLIDYIRIGI